MNTTLRRVTVSLASIAVAATAAIAGASGASAAGDAQSCLDQLSGPAAATPATLVYPAQPAQIRMSTSQYAGDLCRQLSVSIGISRTDLSGFKAANASDNRWTGTGNYYFFAKFVVAPNQPGTWMTRQIAVKDQSGRLAVRTFTAADSPTKVTIRRESFLTGTPTGAAITHNYLTGRLKAWSSVGTLANLANQTVQVQVRAPGASAYKTIAQQQTSTTGNISMFIRPASYPKHDLRIIFASPFQTIASDFTYLGRFA